MHRMGREERRRSYRDGEFTMLILPTNIWEKDSIQGVNLSRAVLAVRRSPRVEYGCGQGLADKRLVGIISVTFRMGIRCLLPRRWRRVGL
jgi:hypothetical protein